MKFLITTIIAILISLAVNNIESAPCGEDESVPWLEIVDIEGNCTKGEKVKYKCKECTCDENLKAKCPKWIKCCEKGAIWQTNSCNICHCTDDYQKICEATKCKF